MGQMRATAPEVRSKVEPWLERVAANTSLEVTPREAAKYLLKGIREARDDGAKKTADDLYGP